MRAIARPLAGRAWARTSRRLQQLQRSEQLGPEEVARLQSRLLASLLTDAHARSAGWRRRLADAGVVDADGVHLDAWHSLPVLEREDVIADRASLCADGLGRQRTFTTHSGGSTGTPVTVIHDVEHLRWARAVKVHFDTWTGYAPGEPKLQIWGAPRDAATGRLRRWLKNERLLDAYHLDASHMLAWAALTHEVQPDQVLGYAESLDEWARFLSAGDVPVTAPRAVMSTAGLLTPAMRARIGRALDAPVFDRYGTREVGDIACERVPGAGLLVSPLNTLVEVLGPDGRAVDPGVEGDVVVTCLTNRVMPLIRYRLGDTASWATPSMPDARPAWPGLASVSGRVTEHFVASGGGLVYAGALRQMLYGLDGVRRYQLVQEDLRTVTVLIVPDAADHESVKAGALLRLARPLGELLGGDVRIEVLLVDDLPLSNTGKHRHTISKVRRATPAALPPEE